MEYFSSGGIDIAYRVEGEGLPILLIHGFASTAIVNWATPGWLDLLARSGRRVIIFDNRGHGHSTKLYDPASYEAHIMAEDACRLLDHLGVSQVDVMGYSMGARIAAFLATRYPERVRRIILGGVGQNLLEEVGVKGAADIIAALEAPELGVVDTPIGQAFRRFADANQADLKALSACIRTSRTPVLREDLIRLKNPVMVAVGTQDDMVGSVSKLTDNLRFVHRLDIPDRDHMRAVGDMVFKRGVLSFLESSM